ncbi:MAG: GntR family transcriptional regulator [Pseudomonadota bacterium]
MEITVDLNGAEPPFAQLISQIRAAVQNGALSPGDPLPSIRQLATDLELNNKTVAKAYRLLERDSIVESRGYRGTFVHREARANSEVDLNAWVAEQLAETVGRLRDAGVTDAEIRTSLAFVMNERSTQGES